MIEIVFMWLFLSVIPAAIAYRKGHSAVMYYFLGLLLSPLIGSIIALVVKTNEEGLERSGEMKKCPKCVEMVKPDAKICRYCQYKFQWVPPATAAHEPRPQMTPERKAELERKMAAGMKKSRI